MSASRPDRKSTRLNSSHGSISYAVFCLKKKKTMYHNKKDGKIVDITLESRCALTPDGKSHAGMGVSAAYYDLACILDIFKIFFFNDTATTEIYTLSLHDALPI